MNETISFEDLIHVSWGFNSCIPNLKMLNIISKNVLRYKKCDKLAYLNENLIWNYLIVFFFPFFLFFPLFQ